MVHIDEHAAIHLAASVAGGASASHALEENGRAIGGGILTTAFGFGALVLAAGIPATFSGEPLHSSAPVTSLD